MALSPCGCCLLPLSLPRRRLEAQALVVIEFVNDEEGSKVVMAAAAWEWRRSKGAGIFGLVVSKVEKEEKLLACGGQGRGRRRPITRFLGRFNTGVGYGLVIDIENDTTWVESGATIGELYYAIAQESPVRGFPAGTTPVVGVGRHFSGGGNGYLNRKYGLSADNVVDTIVVDFRGQILNKESMGSDFFWAIRGGGGASFGVILPWKIKLVSVPPVVIVFRLAKTFEQKVIDLVHKWQCIASDLPDYLTIAVAIQRFGPLNQHSTEVIKNRSYNPFDANVKLKIDLVQKPLPYVAVQQFWKWCSEAEYPRLQLHPFGGIMGSISESKIPFPHRKSVLFEIMYIESWFNDGEGKNSEKYLNEVRGLYELMTPYVQSNPRGSYVNGDDLDFGTNGNDPCGAPILKLRLHGVQCTSRKVTDLEHWKSKKRIMAILVSVMMIASKGGSDLAEDKKECQDQIIDLSSCLPFLSEESKFPSPICCIHLAEKYDKEKRRCLCMAVRDRNEPGFGFKVNATLALALPFICHIQANVTQCIDFLQMDPQSPEAQIFKQSYDNILGNSSRNATTNVTDSSAYSSTNPSSSSRNHGKKWLNMGMAGFVSVWLMISSVICVI
ncbi:OLC1v1024683C1 [Oldenlandia corymbosa var. corymbosa]|uniref:OLC1v1024683C1 n=1 Tax=Oldenlandia corymbosa var. corymbosa TaxID=529605 RepID=A0AAV1C4Q4_OLDCO|nr:OLC1v1024683C1 [Oldenlandia corymbosa var. corymbosa]